MAFADTGSPLPWSEGSLTGACGNRPGIACRITWWVSQNEQAARFVDSALADPINIMLQILLVFVLALIVRRLVQRMITRVTTRMAETVVPQKPPGKTRMVFEGTALLATERRRQRAETVGSVLRHIASIVILGTATLMALGQLGVNLAPVLASASIVGVAVGFGAQNLVRDFLCGIFMLLEDQYGVGDWIDAGPASGTVEAVTLRTTRLRDINGVVWYIRNGEITRVGNESQGWARAVVDVPVSYDEDLARVRELLEQVATEMRAEDRWDEMMLEAPDVWGAEALSGEAVVMRVVVKTAPLRQWEVARELRERLKQRFDQEGVTVGSTFISRDAAMYRGSVPPQTRAMDLHS
jgi:small-conductance mechanosensitive channel